MYDDWPAGEWDFDQEAIYHTSRRMRMAPWLMVLGLLGLKDMIGRQL